MDDCIKREQALKLIESAGTWGWSMNTLYDEIQALPAADVASVVHGKWIHLSGCDVCSVCNYKTGKHEVGRNFCPECGAKLDLEDEE